jgi:hypothetical protein
LATLALVETDNAEISGDGSEYVPDYSDYLATWEKFVIVTFSMVFRLKNYFCVLTDLLDVLHVSLSTLFFWTLLRSFFNGKIII